MISINENGIYSESSRVTSPCIKTLEDNEIFVFGSNIQGKHFGGAAKTALKWGAKHGYGVGKQGQTYAIPTMFNSVDDIRPYVEEFIIYAKTYPDLIFLVTEIGCGIAGFSTKEIAPLFSEAIGICNIYLPESFWKILREL